jgi:hypothetical protein
VLGTGDGLSGGAWAQVQQQLSWHQHTSVLLLQVIVEKAEKSDIPDIDKKK